MRHNESMQPFRELSPTGKTRRLRDLAHLVLADRFGITNASVSLLATHSFNTLFRVDCGDKRRYALRVGDGLRIHALGVEAIEAQWLNSLDAITPMRSLPTVDGTFGDTVKNPGVEEPRVVSLLTWVPGRNLRDLFSNDAAALAGRRLAELHEQASSFKLDTSVKLIRADKPITFGDTAVLGQWQSEYGTLFADAIDRAEGELDRLWASPPHDAHLFHGDFAPHNIMRWRNRLMPIDFQDLQYGFDVQDIAIAFSSWERDYPDAIADFQRGYCDVRSWPAAVEPLLMAALAASRSLNVLNLGLQLKRFGLQESIARHTTAIRTWMSTGPS